MRIPRIFYPKVFGKCNIIKLSPQASHYVINVLRQKKESKVVLFNSSDGFEYKSRIVDITPKKAVILQIIDAESKMSESNIYTHLFQGLSKGKKIDTIIQKSTELGVNEFTPVITEYFNYKINQSDILSRLDRWKRIAISAAEQSDRVFVPKVNDLKTLADSIKIKTEVKIILSPHANNSISELVQNEPCSKSFAIFIGPEGGFSNTEERLVIKENFYKIKLGKRILRTETVPLTILSILQALYGDY